MYPLNSLSILLSVSIHNIKTTSASKMFLACVWHTCLCVCDKTRRGESRTTLRTSSLPLTLCILNGLNMLFPQDATTGS